MRPHRSLVAACLSLLALPLGACVGPDVETEQRFALIGNATVYSLPRTNLTLDTFGAGDISGEGSSEIEDLTGFAGGLGVTTVVPDADGGLPRKVSRFELTYGLPTYEFVDEPFLGTGEVEAWEVAAGGRFFFATTPRIAPFLSAHAVYTQWEEGQILGVAGDLSELDPQLAGRLGGGLEFALAEFLAIDVAADYTLPFDGPTVVDGDGGTAEVDFEGLSVRVGLVLSF